MDFPEEFIERAPEGKHFILHSGGETSVFYDVNSMLMDSIWRERIIKSMPEAYHYVGIPTGGAILAVSAADKLVRKVSMVKDGGLRGNVPEGDCLIVDDVVTTESSLREAYGVLERCGVRSDIRFYSVVDRRPKKGRTLGVKSMFDVGEI